MIVKGIVVSIIFCIILLTGEVECVSREVYPPVNASDGMEHLYFGLMMSLGGTQDSSGMVPAVQVALDLINNSSLLTRYTLHYVLYDSKCDRTTALEELFSLVLYSEWPVVALLGSGCSQATAATAELTHFYNITQISCVSYTTKLSSRRQFQSYYQMLPSEENVVYSLAAIIRKYKWKRVSLLVQNDNRFIEISKNLKKLIILHSNNSVEVNRLFVQSSDDGLELSGDLYRPYYRIYILLAGPVMARTLLCKAYDEDISYPKYLFLTYSMTGSKWWTSHSNESSFYNCTSKDRAKVLGRSLEVSPLQYSSNEEKEESNRPNSFRSGMLYGMPEFCYDATWALAMAVNMTIEGYKGIINGMSLSAELDALSFHGLTGPVVFDSNGIRIMRKHKVIQFRRQPNTSTSELLEYNVGTVKCMEDGGNCYFTYEDGVSDDSLWPEGVPYDGVPLVEVVLESLSLSVVFGTIGTFGILFVIFCLTFNIVFRKTKIIRLTSPNLNYVICIGAMIAYLSEIIDVFENTGEFSSTAALCAIRLTTLPIGYSLAFVTILVKLIRVFIIFKSSKKKVTIKDRHLFVLIAALTFLPIIGGFSFAVSGSISPDVYLESYKENPSSISGALGIETQYFRYRCRLNSLDKKIITAVCWIYLFILKIVALWLAFQIRKVKITGLDDSKFIAAIVYVSSLLLTINFIFFFTINQYAVIYLIAFVSVQILNVTAILGLTFIPKMVSLYRDPKGEGVFGAMSSSNGAKMAILSRPDDVEEMKKKILSLESTIKKLQVAVPCGESSEKISTS